MQCFFLNLPICFLCLVINTLLLHSPPANAAPPLASLKKLDLCGISLIAFSTIMLLLGFDWASQGMSWGSAQIVLCLCASAFALAVFIFVETKASKPVMPLHLFTHPTRIGAYVAAFVHAMGYMGLNYYLPIYFQAVRGQSTSQSGVSMLPLVTMFGVVSTGAGYLITATGR